MKEKVIFDCDPGHDDVMGLILALASEDMEILGIVASAGNSQASRTVNNALRLLSFLEIEGIPVVKGLDGPICRELRIASDVHGETGLDGADLGPVRQEAVQENPIDFLARLLRETDEPVTLIVTGPMTNTAVLLVSHPELKSKIRRISFMGGACFGGNVTPISEFNIYVDPEAASIVFGSGIPLIMCGLDVTMKARLLPDELEKIRALPNKTGPMMAALLDFFTQTTTVDFLHPDRVEGAHLHDPCAVAVLLHPEKFLLKELYGFVCCEDGPSRGSTMIDYDGIYHKKPNVTVAFDLERQWFIEFLTESIQRMR